MKKILLIAGLTLSAIILTALLQKLDPVDDPALTQQIENKEKDSEQAEIIENPSSPADSKEAETLLLLVF
jgi:hypothetical protein